jgi:hypothetical protein
LPVFFHFRGNPSLIGLKGKVEAQPAYSESNNDQEEKPGEYRRNQRQSEEVEINRFIKNRICQRSFRLIEIKQRFFPESRCPESEYKGKSQNQKFDNSLSHTDFHFGKQVLEIGKKKSICNHTAGKEEHQLVTENFPEAVLIGKVLEPEKFAVKVAENIEKNHEDDGSQQIISSPPDSLSASGFLHFL